MRRMPRIRGDIHRKYLRLSSLFTNVRVYQQKDRRQKPPVTLSGTPFPHVMMVTSVYTSVTDGFNESVIALFPKSPILLLVGISRDECVSPSSKHRSRLKSVGAANPGPQTIVLHRCDARPGPPAAGFCRWGTSSGSSQLAGTRAVQNDEPAGSGLPAPLREVPQFCKFWVSLG